MTAEITTTAKYLCNLCDCISIGNKGDALVQSVFQMYPHANCYNGRTATKKAITGTLQIKGDGKGNRYIINLFAQFYPGFAKYPNDNILKRIEWFNSCLEKMLDIPDLESLAFPGNLGISNTSDHSSKYDDAISDFRKKYYLRHQALITVTDYQDKDYFLTRQDQSEKVNYDVPIDVLQTDIPLIYNRRDIANKNSVSSQPPEEEITVVKKIDLSKLRYIGLVTEDKTLAMEKVKIGLKPSAEAISQAKVKIPLKTSIVQVNSVKPDEQIVQPKIKIAPKPQIQASKLGQNFLADDQDDQEEAIIKTKIPIKVITQSPKSVAQVVSAVQNMKIYDKNPTWKVPLSQLHIDSSWDPIFKDPKMLAIMSKLDKAFEQEMETFGDHIEILPQPQELIFNAFNQCAYPPQVIILGQDPYFANLNEAMGLAFSVPDGVAIPSSLSNVFKELSDDLPSFKKPKSGDLTKWAKQGILLLNTALTVRYKQKEVHLKIWLEFINTVISLLTQHNNNIVFMLWGNPAKAKKDKIVNKDKHLVLEAAHPSGLSAHKGFYGCKHFSQCNEYLIKNKKTPINW